MNRNRKFRYWDPWNEVMVLSVQFKNLCDFFYSYQLAVDGGNGPILEDFTGLEDSAGSDVYEGDIANSLRGVGYVYWSDRGYLFEFDIDSTDLWGLSTGIELEQFKKLGNIHQNPELIK